MRTQSYYQTVPGIPLSGDVSAFLAEGALPAPAIWDGTALQLQGATPNEGTVTDALVIAIQRTPVGGYLATAVVTNPLLLITVGEAISANDYLVPRVSIANGRARTLYFKHTTEEAVCIAGRATANGVQLGLVPMAMLSRPPTVTLQPSDRTFTFDVLDQFVNAELVVNAEGGVGTFVRTFTLPPGLALPDGRYNARLNLDFSAMVQTGEFRSFAVSPAIEDLGRTGEGYGGTTGVVQGGVMGWGNSENTSVVAGITLSCAPPLPAPSTVTLTLTQASITLTRIG